MTQYRIPIKVSWWAYSDQIRSGGARNLWTNLRKYFKKIDKHCDKQGLEKVFTAFEIVNELSPKTKSET